MGVWGEGEGEGGEWGTKLREPSESEVSQSCPTPSNPMVLGKLIVYNMKLI